MMIFRDFIKTAIEQRPNLRETIGYSDNDFSCDIEGIPESIAALYSVAEGTPRSIEDQSVMDIVPGYRLIHKSELQSEIASFRAAYPALGTHFPFFADYSSCYYTVNSADAAVYLVDKEYGAEAISKNIEQFLKTILAFYNRGVYFLDVDGYLDYDSDREGIIGAEYNPDYSYWTNR